MRLEAVWRRKVILLQRSSRAKSAQQTYAGSLGALELVDNVAFVGTNSKAGSAHI
jgi:hypothetical protein